MPVIEKNSEKSKSELIQARMKQLENIRAYFQTTNLPAVLEELVNDVGQSMPEDCFGILVCPQSINADFLTIME